MEATIIITVVVEPMCTPVLALGLSDDSGDSGEEDELLPRRYTPGRITTAPVVVSVALVAVAGVAGYGHRRHDDPVAARSAPAPESPAAPSLPTLPAPAVPMLDGPYQGAQLGQNEGP
jgi:hypothetical protein